MALCEVQRYKLHLVVDADHELPVAYEVTKASAGEAPIARKLVKRVSERHEDLMKNTCEVYLYDNVNAAADGGFTPLHVAVASGEAAMTEFLLANGAAANKPDSDGSLPLHVAASYGRDRIVEILLAHKADVNVTMSGGSTPLHGAAWFGQLAAAELLVAGGADVNAVEGDEASIKQVLLAHKAATSIRCMPFRGSVQYAAESVHVYVCTSQTCPS